MERIPVVRIVSNVRQGKMHYKDSFNEIYWVQKTNEHYTKRTLSLSPKTISKVRILNSLINIAICRYY